MIRLIVGVVLLTVFCAVYVEAGGHQMKRIWLQCRRRHNLSLLIVGGF